MFMCPRGNENLKNFQTETDKAVLILSQFVE